MRMRLWEDVKERVGNGVRVRAGGDEPRIPRMEAVSLVRAWRTCAGARRVWEGVTGVSGWEGRRIGEPSPAATAVQDRMLRMERAARACESELEIRVVSCSLWLGAALALIRDSGGRRVGLEVLNQTFDRTVDFGSGGTSMRTFHLSSRSAVVASIPRAEMMLPPRSRKRGVESRGRDRVTMGKQTRFPGAVVLPKGGVVRPGEIGCAAELLGILNCKV
ncbi:hypothetical protein R3P38DRAFT_576994 [Favolaschia claudopus]|uniref:Uncharacterized protein n=1 Tax=Favolaschia claudopus TaxID=2862362 RepID=A0AAV9Z9U2_9AGAR